MTKRMPQSVLLVQNQGIFKRPLLYFQLLPKLLFPLFLHFLFWDPDNADPMSAASVEKAIDFMINPAIGVPRLYMISGLVRVTMIVMHRLS